MAAIKPKRERPSEGLLILGDQLFSTPHLKSFKGLPCFMAEDLELCTHFRYHKQKLVLFLSAMRHFRDANKNLFDLDYQELGRPGTYFQKLEAFLKTNIISTLHHFEIEDKFFESRFKSWAKTKVKLVEHPSPAFLTLRGEFESYLTHHKKPFMKSFYEGQRKNLNVLLTNRGQPVGGAWSFDKENRKPYKSNQPPPALPAFNLDATTRDVQRLVEQFFSDHPGSVADFNYPVTHHDADILLDRFIGDRLKDFGAYEDAIHGEHTFLFHSGLSPLLNMGLLTPKQVIDRVLKAYESKSLPIASVEGFVRQVIGWREFVRGIYRNYSDVQERTNFWGHSRRLKPCWYKAETGILPLDRVIHKVQKYAYAHHIERLMVVGNIMLLCKTSPLEAHRWFMEMFIDSADWVMGPNVFGMSQFSDGGIFATKPYICASNYILKMSNYSRGEWCQDLDALYWNFISEHLDYFQKQPRLSMMANLLRKKSKSEKMQYHSRAERVIDRLTEAA